ncbi:hypothetical protein M501DRAFT_1024596 [Patellaria atrata CBS 101060]|uniref:EamA domain-containing protein n=1 Tax=Patellaria atrata CBS 101060 TaxID=1346257 RepID=A0A9P4VRE5_9PEZI|nr:hypothetical protein M501DRAFT_1024596 [Patellaria atrata CBS 101060]
MTPPKPKTAWIGIAIASGACAAFNGVFAKLTTTELTTTWAHGVSGFFGMSPDNKIVEFGVRAFFFVLNLVFNGVMWGLFTRALTLASSTVRVSVINTSANFMLTAFLGAIIFSEALPGLWWLGAALLVAGSVVIGAREGREKKEEGDAGTAGEPLVARASVDAGYRDSDEGSDREVSDSVELDEVGEMGSGSDDGKGEREREVGG